MKIGVTGGSGFLGTALIQALAKQVDVDEIICIIKTGGSKIQDSSKKVKIFEVDFQDVEGISRIFQNIDVLVHMAAELDSSQRNLEIINIEFTKNLSFICSENGARLIFLSSITVLKKKHITPYSKTKKIAENIIRDMGIQYVIIRPSWIIGKNSRSWDNLINKIKKLPIIPIIGTGNTLLSPIYLDDCVEFIIKVIVNSPKNITYNIFGIEEFTYSNFIKRIGGIIAPQKKTINLPKWVGWLVCNLTPFLSADAYSDFLESTSYNKNDIKIFVSSPIKISNFIDNIKIQSYEKS